MEKGISTHLTDRKKWYRTERNVQVNDVILLIDKDLHRNDWPLGVVTNVFPGGNDIVRKVGVKVSRNERVSSYIETMNEIVVLLER